MKVEEDEELEAAAELDESTVLDLLRARLTALGVKTTKAVEGVIKDGLAAKKYVNVTCKGCGKRSRHSIADMSTRLATVKLIATELTPELSDRAAPLGDVDLRGLSTAQLQSAVFPERERWITDFQPQRQPGRQSRVGPRRSGGAGRPEASSARDSSTEAKSALADMQAIHGMLAPARSSPSPGGTKAHG